jgi:hypothetical protein
MFRDAGNNSGYQAALATEVGKEGLHLCKEKG